MTSSVPRTPEALGRGFTRIDTDGAMPMFAADLIFIRTIRVDPRRGVRTKTDFHLRGNEGNLQSSARFNRGC
jgi:hypothetical protein